MPEKQWVFDTVVLSNFLIANAAHILEKRYLYFSPNQTRILLFQINNNFPWQRGGFLHSIR